MLNVRKYYDELSKHSSLFLSKSKDPSNEYEHPNYAGLRVYISYIIKLQTKSKSQPFFSYNELLKCIKESCAKPLVDYTALFLFLKIYIPIIQKLQDTADMEFAFEILEEILKMVEIQKLSIDIFNILIRKHSDYVASFLIKHLEQHQNSNIESFCNILNIAGKCEFGEHVESIERILSLVLPKARTILRESQFNQFYTAGLMCLLNRSVYESSSHLYTKWFDEIKPQKISTNNDKKKFKKLILISLAVHNKNLLNKSVKLFSVIEDGLKFNGLNEAITLLIRSITLNNVKCKIIEDVLSHPPKSFLMYPNIVCQILERYINLNNIDETYYFESLAKSDVYECLIYYSKINNNMKVDMLKKALAQNRYDLLLKIINNETFKFAIPVISELIRLQYPYYLMLEYCSSNLSIVSDVISSTLINITKFINVSFIDSMLCLIIELLELIKNYHKCNGNKKKFLTTLDIQLCNAISFIYLIAQNSNLRLLAQCYSRLIFDIYCFEFPDWEKQDVFEIPIFHFLYSYPNDKLEIIYSSFEEISSSLKEVILSDTQDETQDIFKLLLSKTKRNIIYQLFLIVYNGSEKFKDTMNRLFSNTSQQYITIKCLRIISNFSQNNINFIQSLILQSSKRPIIYAIAYASNENKMKILSFLRTSPIPEFQKIRIVRHILQKIISEKSSSNTFNNFLIYLVEIHHIFQEFVNTFILTEIIKEYIMALLYSLTIVEEPLTDKNILIIYDLFVQSIEKLAEIYEKDGKNECTEIIFKIYIKLSVLLINSESSFDLQKCFSTINSILTYIPTTLSINELDRLFLIISKDPTIFTSCINNVKLTTFTKCYVIGYFSIKYYPLIQTDEHLAFSIALALVVQDELFLKCPNLIDCLDQIQWTSSTNPSLSRKRSAARSRRNTNPTNVNGKIPKKNTSRFISGTVLNLTEIFVKKVIHIICEPEISQELFERFMTIILPWLANLKLTSLSKFQNVFDYLFEEKCLKHARFYAMKVIIPTVQLSSDFFLDELFKRNFPQDYYILIFQYSDSKEKVVEFLESKILIQQKIQFCIHILYQFHFLDKNLISNARLLALIYPFLISKHEIMIYLKDIMKIFGEYESIDLLLKKNGKEFKKEFIFYIISFLGYKMDSSISSILFKFSKEYARKYKIEYIMKFFNVMGRKDSQLELIAQHLLSLYPIVPEESKKKIYEFGKIMLQTENKEITKSAFEILKDDPQNKKIIFQCLLRGTLEYEEIRPYIDSNNLDKENVYWYRIMEGIEIDESCFPELDDMFCAIKYGSFKLIDKIAESIPTLIEKGFVISHLLNQMFDVKNINIKKLSPIFNQIPTELFVLPKNLDKPNLILKLPIISLESNEHLRFMKNSITN